MYIDDYIEDYICSTNCLLHMTCMDFNIFMKWYRFGLIAQFIKRALENCSYIICCMYLCIIYYTNEYELINFK